MAGEWIADLVGSAGSQAPKCGEFLRVGNARLHGFQILQRSWRGAPDGEVPWQEESASRKPGRSAATSLQTQGEAEMQPHPRATFFSNDPSKAMTGKERMATIAIARGPQALVNFAIWSFVFPGLAGRDRTKQQQSSGSATAGMVYRETRRNNKHRDRWLSFAARFAVAIRINRQIRLP